VVQAPSVAITAESSPDMTSAAVGGVGSQNFALGGSLTLNDVKGTIDAHVSNRAHVDATDEVLITARDASTISSLAGGVAVAGTGSIAGAAASNKIANHVLAHISGPDTQVEATTGRVAVTAREQAVIETLSIGLGGAGTFSLTGAVSINEIKNKIEAYADAGATVTAAGDVELLATDLSVIAALAGQVGGAGSGAPGAAPALNPVGQRVPPPPPGPAPNPTRTVQNGRAEGPAGPRRAARRQDAAHPAISGSMVVNTLANTVEAFIASSTVTADDNVVVVASFDGGDSFAAPDTLDTEDSFAVGTLIGTDTNGDGRPDTGAGVDGINSFAGAFGGAFVGIAGARVVNTIKNTTRAYVVDSTVAARGNGPDATIPTFDPDTSPARPHPAT